MIPASINPEGAMFFVNLADKIPGTESVLYFSFCPFSPLLPSLNYQLPLTWFGKELRNHPKYKYYLGRNLVHVKPLPAKS